jgi:crotonyl-CoA carboxylase/reductase
MQAIVIRADRHGDPEQSMLPERIDVPALGPREVLVRVMAAGVNYNAIWAARGKPISPLELTGDDFHIAGSDAAGIVWSVGSAVTNWKVGDEVVLHCNQACGECVQCNGGDPMACAQQRIWGYETNWGAFAEFTKVQSQQLMPKPKHLSWFEASSYSLTLCTAYRMLIERGGMKPGDVVLVWGALGGLGVFALQLCRATGASAVAVVSTREKGEMAVRLGARGYVLRGDFDFAYREGESADRERQRITETRRMGRAIRELTGGRDPDIVFEHVGAETFPASCLLAGRFGRVVICGATSGYKLMFDVRHVWMRQKQIIGSHFANAYQANRANQLVCDGLIQPIISRVLPFHQTGRVHTLMQSNLHHAKMIVAVGAPLSEQKAAPAWPVGRGALAGTQNSSIVAAPRG